MRRTVLKLTVAIVSMVAALGGFGAAPASAGVCSGTCVAITGGYTDPGLYKSITFQSNKGEYATMSVAYIWGTFAGGKFYSGVNKDRNGGATFNVWFWKRDGGNCFRTVYLKIDRLNSIYTSGLFC